MLFLGMALPDERIYALLPFGLCLQNKNDQRKVRVTTPLTFLLLPLFDHFPSAQRCQAGTISTFFPAADWWGPPNGGWSIFNTCANHRFHQSLSVSRQPKFSLALGVVVGT